MKYYHLLNILQGVSLRSPILLYCILLFSTRSHAVPDFIVFGNHPIFFLIIYITSFLLKFPVLAAAPDITALYVFLNNLSPHYIKYYTIHFLLITLFSIVIFLLTTRYLLM